MRWPRLGPRHQTTTAAARGTAGSNRTTICSAVIRSTPARRRFVEWFTEPGGSQQAPRLFWRRAGCPLWPGRESSGAPVAAYLRVREGKVAETREVKEGVAFADYDGQGALLGVELLAPCQAADLDRVAASEPEPVRRFLRAGAPRALVAG